MEYPDAGCTSPAAAPYASVRCGATGGVPPSGIHEASSSMMFSFSTGRPILFRRRYKRRFSSSNGTCTRATKQVSSTNTVSLSTGSTYRKLGTRQTPSAPGASPSSSGSDCLKSMNTALFTSNGWSGMRTSTPYAVCHPGGGPSPYRSMSRLCPVLHTTRRAFNSNSASKAVDASISASSNRASDPRRVEGSSFSECVTWSTKPGMYRTPCRSQRFKSSSRSLRRHTWPYGRPKPIPSAGSSSLNHTSASSYSCKRQSRKPSSSNSSSQTP
mmetsp:Transcript_7944/g.33201  ORF Transcript_7944/g.33201 Transcript_7944/m.33201 type:complete len:271 (+) Transcript_7944:4241-5053(+)